MEDRLGGGDAEDEVGLEQQWVDAQRRASGVADVDEVGRLGVVHLDPAVEAARERRGEQRLELALAGAPVEPAGDENRLARRRDAQPLELADRGGERVAAGSPGAPGSGSSGASTTSVAVPPRETSASSGEPESGKRSASRTAAATSTTPSEGRRGRSTTPSRTFTTAIREPDGIGTRGIRRSAGRPGAGGDASAGSRASARSGKRAGSSSASRARRSRSRRDAPRGARAPRAPSRDPRRARRAASRRRGGARPQGARPVERGVAERGPVALGDQDHRGLVLQELDPVVPQLLPLRRRQARPDGRPDLVLADRADDVEEQLDVGRPRPANRSRSAGREGSSARAGADACTCSWPKPSAKNSCGSGPSAGTSTMWVR